MTNEGDGPDGGRPITAHELAYVIAELGSLALSIQNMVRAVAPELGGDGEAAAERASVATERLFGIIHNLISGRPANDG